MTDEPISPDWREFAKLSLAELEAKLRETRASGDISEAHAAWLHLMWAIPASAP
jgi:hypothetical protein